MIARIEDLTHSTDQEVTLEGRVQSIATSNIPDRRCFDVLSDGQRFSVVWDVEAAADATKDAARALTVQSLVRITGYLQPHEPANGDAAANGSGSKVVHVQACTIVARAAADLPAFAGGELSGTLDERLDHRILDQRAAAAGAMFRLHSAMSQLIVEFLTREDFTWLHTPRIRGSHVAGDNEYFHVPYFGRDAWLCQHTQHALQAGIGMDMRRVFDLGPVFRAEVKSQSSARHMTEFTMLGTNMTYEHDWHEVVDLLGSMLAFVFHGLQERKQYAPLLAAVRQYYPSARPFRVGLDKDGKIPRITFLDAKRMLREELGFPQSADAENFTPEEEAALGRHFRTAPHLGQTDLFTIEHFPLAMRQFNSQTVKGAPHLSETWDFIAGGREVCSGSHRISDYDELCAAMRSCSTGPAMDPESEQWRGWVAAFKTGMPPHAGASFGVNRILQAFLGLDEIRETTFLPRDANRLAP